MSTITIDLDNLTEEEQETVKRLAEKKKPYWVPEKGETYFLIDEYGCIDYTQNDEKDGDDFTISIGNCFKTKEEAKEAITRLQMQTKWKRLSLEAGEAENPWDKKHGHWYLFYDSTTSIILIYNNVYLRNDSISFPTKESLEAAIDELGEENVKKYILGVEEWKLMK